MKPSSAEEEYFAKEEAARLKNQAMEKSREMQGHERDQLKALHFMHCPKCGFELKTLQFKGLSVDRCFHCGGTWLDAGELEQLAGKEQGFLHDVLAVFRHDKR